MTYLALCLFIYCLSNSLTHSLTHSLSHTRYLGHEGILFPFQLVLVLFVLLGELQVQLLGPNTWGAIQLAESQDRLSFTPLKILMEDLSGFTAEGFGG
jgi:hypothetical protein